MMLRDDLSDAEWLVTRPDFDPARHGAVETLFTVGNGYLGTRGTLEEGHYGEVSGTYIAGVYDDHDAATTDLVNAPDWLPLAVYANDVRLDVQSCRVLSHERALDMRRGLLWRESVLEDTAGRRTRIESVRLASMADRHLCAMRLAVTPLNHSGVVRVESGLNGHRRNLDRLPVYPEDAAFHPEVEWEKWALSRHLEHVDSRAGDERLYLRMRTISQGTELEYASALSCAKPVEHRTAHASYERAQESIEVRIDEGGTVVVDKFVAIRTSRDVEQASALDTLASARAAGFENILEGHVSAWDELWGAADVRVIGDEKATQALRFGNYHLTIAANPDDPTVNIGAKSLSGEGYRGHVFWDTEALMLPYFVYTQPDAARALLKYRHHVLPAARDLARESGQRGARYPWESADSGREECPLYTNDGAHRFWTRDEEIHVTADVAYGVMTYVTATGDQKFLLDSGAEILFETARFWADRVSADEATDGLRILQVMGPDEFHSHIDDNAFTNELARWNLLQAVRARDLLQQQHPDQFQRISDAIGLGSEEPDEWRQVAERIVRANVSPDGVIEQFAGYFDRLDVPVTSWDENEMPRYPEGYNHFNCEETMLLKQPDVVMLMQMFPEEFSAEAKRASFDFYEARTLHKSSLSPAIHAIMGLTVGDPRRALQYFYRSALVDLTDNQGNTREGIHIASCAGTWQTLVYGFAGFRVHENRPAFVPHLPETWTSIEFRIQWRGAAIDVALSHEASTFVLLAPDGTTQDVDVAGRTITLTAGEPATIALAAAVI